MHSCRNHIHHLLYLLRVRLVGVLIHHGRLNKDQRGETRYIKEFSGQRPVNRSYSALRGNRSRRHNVQGDGSGGESYADELLAANHVGLHERGDGGRPRREHW